MVQRLRAALLRYIIENNFQRVFGDTWWEDELLQHMRDESMHRQDPSGEKYAVTLRKYGRQIAFKDLDTTVCCAIMLFDNRYKFGKTAVGFSNYEIGLARQLHALRNKVSHDERDESESPEAEERTIKLLYGAVKMLDLRENAPKLAKEILEEYKNAFDDAAIDTNDEMFMARFEKFERAEAFYKWDVEKALPLYNDLAAEGFQGAKKRLFEIHTKSVKYFDLNKAIMDAADDTEICSASDLETLKALNGIEPHVIWGTKEAVAVWKRELDSGRLIANRQIKAYIKWIQEEYANGLLQFLATESIPQEFIHEISKKSPQIEKLEQIAAQLPDSNEKNFCETLITAAKSRCFEPSKMAHSLRALAENEYEAIKRYLVEDSEAIVQSRSQLSSEAEDVLNEASATIDRQQEELQRLNEQVNRYRTIIYAEAAGIGALLIAFLCAAIK